MCKIDYIREKAEIMKKEFIKTIIVSYSGFFGGAEKRTLTQGGEKILVEREFYNGAFDDGKILYNGKTWNMLLDELDRLHIDEWDEEYDDPDVLDGIQWSLDIKFSDKTEGLHYWGSSKYPENFDVFMIVMEIR